MQNLNRNCITQQKQQLMMKLGKYFIFYKSMTDTKPSLCL